VDALAPVAGRESLTVVVTDSGLGGLAVAAEIERLARATRAYRALRLVFASALPEARRGYNTFASHAGKVRVFDAALAGMVRAFRPDALLVACNTLSVLLPQTRAAAAVPTLGIVELGAELLAERLRETPGGTAIVFATETTIAAGAHRALLLARGVAPDRIVEQACPLLAREIEIAPAGAAVRAMVEGFAAEAVGRMAHRGDAIVAGLCCTHYGYLAAGFLDALRPLARERVEVVDPNRRMAEALFPPAKPPFAGPPALAVEVVSRAQIFDFEIASIAPLVEPVSPATAAALRSYERRRDLFPFAAADADERAAAASQLSPTCGLLEGRSRGLPSPPE
jgi:glutamate racemase